MNHYLVTMLCQKGAETLMREVDLCDNQVESHEGRINDSVWNWQCWSQYKSRISKE